MNSPEESAVRDLGHFTMAVLNGMVDMESSAADLIRYQFSMRTVKDVIRRASEDPELINQIRDHIFHLVIYLNEEIVATSGKATNIGMENRHFVELQKRMQLMYEVWLGMQVNAAYKSDDIVKHIDASKESIKHTYDMCKDFHRWKDLPSTLREFFLDEKEQVPPVIEEVEPTMFARADGVVSSIAHEKAQSDEEGKKKQFVAKTEKVLSNYRAKNPDYKTMRELIKAKTAFQLEGIYCDGLINQFISVWDMAIDHETTKLDEKYAFTALLKKVFLMMVDKRRNDFAIKLFDKYKNDADVLPCLENFVENFESGLTDAINKLPLDPNALSNNTELFEKVKAPIMWYLLVSPALTVQKLLTICVDNKGYTPIINRIFRAMPTLFEREVNLTPLPFEEPEKKDKLLITILHRVFMLGRINWTAGPQYDNAGMMAMSFAKDRKRKEGQAERPEDKAVVDLYSLITFCFEELLKEKRKPTRAVEVIVKMLQRLLANNNNNRMATNFRFGTSFKTEPGNVIDTTIVIQLMYELLMEYDGQSAEVCDGAREILKSIAGRLDNDGIVFEKNAISFMTSDIFNGAPWWIKYSLFSWFSESLQKPKRQVPSGVYKIIPEQHKDQFEHIKSDESYAVADCFLRSIFELGLFDVDLAIDLLKYGHAVKFEDSVVEKIALALVDSYGKKMSKRNSGLNMGQLIIAILVIFDPIRALAPLNTYCTTYLDSLKKVEHILVLFTAARIAREKQLSVTRLRTGDAKNATNNELMSVATVSEHLVDIFCETTKAHIEREATEVTKIRRDAEALIFSRGATSEQIRAMIERDEREQSLTLQLTMIYLKCSHFCRLYQTVPIKLQQLMNSTLEKQFDSQKLLAKRVMDDVLTDQRKTEVVYAFAEQKDVPDEPKDVVQPVKPSDLYAAKPRPLVENVSAENAMFNGGGNRSGKGNYSTNRGHVHRQGYENDRQSSSRTSSQNERRDSYRGNRWPPVNDVQSFGPREREIIYRSTRNQSNQSNNNFDRGSSRNESSRFYEQEKLYYDERRTPYNQGSSNDVRRSSESRDRTPNYDSSRDTHPPRWNSESECDDSENRLLDNAIQSVRKFNQQHQQQKFSRPSTSNQPPSKCQEGKQQQQQQPKKGFGNEYRNNGNQRKQNDRKPRFHSSNFHEQEEEINHRIKPAERDELADALGYNDPDPPQQPRFRYN